MPKDNLNMQVFQNETDEAQNLIDDFFSNFDCQRISKLRGSGIYRCWGSVAFISGG